MSISWRPRWLAIARLLVAGMLIFFALAVRRQWRAVSADVHPKRLPVTVEDDATARAQLPGCSDVTLKTHDGLHLAAWYVPGHNGAAVVLVHGAWSNRVAMLPEATALAERGYGVLLFDSRADGNSEGDTCTWGDRERDDVAAAVEFVAEQPDVKRIGALGFSVGAYSVSGAAARDPRIRAVVLEAATPSLREAEDWDNRPYGALLTYPTELLYRLQGGLRIPEINVVAALKSMGPRPVLIVVGSVDPWVLPWMTDEVMAAAPGPKALYVVAGAGHGGYLQAAGAAYLSTLTFFFDDKLR